MEGQVSFLLLLCLGALLKTKPDTWREAIGTIMNAGSFPWCYWSKTSHDMQVLFLGAIGPTHHMTCTCCYGPNMSHDMQVLSPGAIGPTCHTWCYGSNTSCTCHAGSCNGPNMSHDIIIHAGSLGVHSCSHAGM